MKFENKHTPESFAETIETIKLSEYKNLPPDVRKWLQMNEDVPNEIWERLSEYEPGITVKDALQNIRKAFDKVCQNTKLSKPSSFEESRFTSFEDIVKQNMRSCGIHTRVYGTTLRKMGVPVRFVDGKRVGDVETTDHAWLDIYSPKSGEWIECDPGERDFDNSVMNKRERIFHDWDELKAIHQKK